MSKALTRGTNKARQQRSPHLHPCLHIQLSFPLSCRFILYLGCAYQAQLDPLQIRDDTVGPQKRETKPSHDPTSSPTTTYGSVTLLFPPDRWPREELTQGANSTSLTPKPAGVACSRSSQRPKKQTSRNPPGENWRNAGPAGLDWVRSCHP